MKTYVDDDIVSKIVINTHVKLAFGRQNLAPRTS